MGFKQYMDELLEDYDREEHEDILETARVISADDRERSGTTAMNIQKMKEDF